MGMPAAATEAEAAETLSVPDNPPGFSEHASELALNALSLLGIRYKYGGDTPDSGLDCSGLVRYVFKHARDQDLPRTAQEISRLGSKVDTVNLQPGDLVFYNTLKRRFSHVGIYLGSDRFIHAPSGGGEVRIDDMKTDYWKKRFNGARRIEESPPS
ncbi:MAG: cell wall hydrolase [Paucimonas sp.]|jgi:cell wall-associated NlpC family hydrolase|nr:cell wall hydrolase [Paucimonas sp.]